MKGLLKGYQQIVLYYGACITLNHTRDLWMNGERDPFALFWLALGQPALLFTKRVAPLYLDVRDMRPFLCAFSDLARSSLSRLLRKITGKLMINKSSSMSL